ncbi:hypothetical protein ABZ920_09780 [Streptomyces sp. NPDC046831]|uniref:hypothetical protein n=1 Tax=Streptomyces sp. NPDC046831 TaxID=3154805 RepID=UPI0033F0AA4C
MEQRIGSSSQPLKVEPVKGAGFDPAFIPGLTAPAVAAAAAGPGDARPDNQSPAEEGSPAGEAPVAEAAGGSPGAGEPADAVPAGDVPAGDTEDGAADGPVFEASDRRARIVADRRGVRLRLDDQECEFRWDEIGAVETEVPRFGKRFTVTVHTPDRRWYPIEIEAPARSRFQEWETRLDEVLDAYFEDGEAERARDAESAKDAGDAEAAGSGKSAGDGVKTADGDES